MKQRVFEHILAFVLMQMCTCWKEHMKEVIDHVFWAFCMVCPARAIRWSCQDCNRQSIQQVQNTWTIVSRLCLNAQTQM